MSLSDFSTMVVFGVMVMVLAAVVFHRRRIGLHYDDTADQPEPRPRKPGGFVARSEKPQSGGSK